MPIILHHHERYAGHGYPYGLRANEIPLGARIVAIADAYDAMTHDRPYKRAMTPRGRDRRAATARRHAVRSRSSSTLFCDLYTATAPTPDPTVEAIIDSVAELDALDWGARLETDGSSAPSVRSGATLRSSREVARLAAWPRVAEGVDGDEDQRSVASS